jgi:hypothetical protein
MEFNNPPGDRQPGSRSLKSLPGIEPLEHVKEPSCLALGDPNSVISHRHDGFGSIAHALDLDSGNVTLIELEAVVNEL